MGWKRISNLRFQELPVGHLIQPTDNIIWVYGVYRQQPPWTSGVISLFVWNEWKEKKNFYLTHRHPAVHHSGLVNVLNSALWLVDLSRAFGNGEPRGRQEVLPFPYIPGIAY